MDKPNDVHSVLARKISEIIGREFARGPAKSVKYGCLPVASSEVLTSQGWATYSDLSVGDAVLTYNEHTGQLEWDTVQAIQFYADAEVVRMKQRGFDVTCTNDHRWYGKRRVKTETAGDVENCSFMVSEMTSEHSILTTAPIAPLDGEIPVEVAAFFGWLLSDGYYKWSELSERTACSRGVRKGVTGSIAQDASKYVGDLRSDLEAVGAEYVEDIRGTMHIFRLRAVWLREILDRYIGREQKHETNWLKFVLRMGKAAMKAFYHAFFLADGHRQVTGKDAISQNRGQIFDAVRVVMLLLGKSCGETPKGNGKCFTIYEKRSPFIGAQRMQVSQAGVADVFCITTANGSFVMRQGGYVGITGNCTYGAQAAKVAKTIGSDLSTGQVVFDAFWQAAAPLASLKEDLQVEWKRFDKRRIVGIDDRLVPTRSAHAILNSKFQSSGVICAKRAMVLHDRKLKAEGLLVDFFVDSLEGRGYAQQLIAMHDEAQMEVNKGSVTFKRFKTKEEAQAFKDAQLAAGRVWSDIKDSPKGGVFVGYCRAGELAVEAVSEVSKDFKMNVDLTAGYIIGTSWKTCH